MTELRQWEGKLCHHPWLFKALWIKAFINWHTILQNSISKAYIFCHIDQEKLIFWFTSAVDNHNMKPQAWQREGSCGPASTFTTNYQTATLSFLLYTAPMCVLNTGSCNQQILHILPLRCLANIKGGKGWCGISVCLCLLLYKTARLSAPRHRQGAAEEIWFHDYHVATWQVGLWFMCFVGFACTWLRVDHTSLKRRIRYENPLAKDPSFYDSVQSKKYQNVTWTVTSVEI